MACQKGCNAQPPNHQPAPPHRVQVLSRLIAESNRLQRSIDALDRQAQAAGFPVTCQGPERVRVRAERLRREAWARIAAAAGATEVAEVGP